MCLRLSVVQIDGSFSCICSEIDHEFRHNIVKVAVDQRGVAEWIRRLLRQCYDKIDIVAFLQEWRCCWNLLQLLFIFIVTSSIQCLTMSNQFIKRCFK